MNVNIIKFLSGQKSKQDKKTILCAFTKKGKNYMLNYTLAFCITVVIFCIYIVIKNENTYNKRYLISKAIYCLRIKNSNANVNYCNMEDYNKTLFRLFDWGYKDILSKEDFEVLEPYIELERK